MDFLQRSACHGQLPACFETPPISRRALLMRMIAERKKVRYVTAPPRYGKSHLIAEYAQTVFGFHRVLWVDARNACFIRDLDAGGLAAAVQADFTEPGLLVLEDVERLNDERTVSLWCECNLLVQQGWEVVISATSNHDPLRAFAEECEVLDAGDLLLDDDDTAAFLQAAGDHLHRVDDIAPARRIAGLFDADANERQRFLAAQVHAGLTPQQAAVVFVCLLLKQGLLAEIDAFLSRCSITFSVYRQMFPFLGIDLKRGTFEALSLAPSEIVRAFEPYLGHMSQAAGYESANDFVIDCADLLRRTDASSRISALMSEMSNPRATEQWLCEHYRDLLRSGDVDVVQELFEYASATKRIMPIDLCFASASSLALMNIAVAADECLIKASGHPMASTCTRACADVLAGLLGRPSCCLDAVLPSKRPTSAAVGSGDIFGAIRDALFCYEQSPEACLDLIDQTQRSDPGAAALMLATFLHLLGRVGHTRKGHVLLRTYEQRIGSLVRDVVHHCTAAGRPQLEEWILCGQARSLAGRMGCPSFVPASFTDARCEEFQARLAQARLTYRHADTADSSQSFGAADRHQPAVTTSPFDASGNRLRINIFGGVEIIQGETIIDHRNMHRVKTKSLLALMVLNKGRDVSCDYLARQFWPDADEDSARKSFYTLSSLMRASLPETADGRPYYIRKQGLCHLDATLFESDVEQLAQLCHRLHFDASDPLQTIELLEMIAAVYRNGLMPGSSDLSALDAARSEWRRRVCDAAMAASMRLSSQGNPEAALCCARQALTWDRHREDAYKAVFSLNVEAGRRPAAIDAWNEYRTFLSEELGLDPSREALDLYTRMLA